MPKGHYTRKPQPLTFKQEAACRKLMELKDKSAAYRAAYNTTKMKPNVVNVKAHQFFKQGKIKVRVEELRKKAAYRSEISTDRVLREERAIAYIDPAKLFDLETGTFIPPYELPEEVRRAIASFKATELWKLSQDCPHCGKYPYERGNGNGKKKSRKLPQKLYRFEYKFWDKGKSIERLSKHLGLYEKDNLQKALRSELIALLFVGLPAKLRDMLTQRLEVALGGANVGQKALPAPTNEDGA